MMKSALAITIAFGLTACVPGGTSTQMVTAMTGMNAVVGANQAPTSADMAMSCKDVNARLNNLYARYNQIEAEQKAQQRKQAMVDGALGLGMGILGTNAIASAGSVDGIRAVSTAATVGGGLVDLATAEKSGAQLQEVNNAAALATRASQLEKVKLQKGC